MQCIGSAETVLEIRNLIIGDHSIGGFTYILSHFLMAAIILAVDVCFNPDEIWVSKRKQDVLRACRLLEEELNAKMAIPSGGGSESYTGGKLMLKSFQKAVQSLRRIVRRKLRKETLQDLGTGTCTIGVGKDVVSTDSRGNDPYLKEPAILPEGQRRKAHPAVTNSQVSSASVTEMVDYHAQRIIYEQMDKSPSHDKSDKPRMPLPPLPAPPYDEHIHNQLEESNSFGDLSVELWDEFFSVGQNFNGSDWDTFLIDWDEQMGGMGTNK